MLRLQSIALFAGKLVSIILVYMLVYQLSRKVRSDPQHGRSLPNFHLRSFVG